jgi:3-hydroxyacyl-CoA dehydrogenase
VAPHLGSRAILATNTSGLSVERLARALPEAVRERFCGVHFFNPPRYMHLVELVPAETTASATLDRLETFLVTSLGKGVVRCRDTPNFIANRIGVFSLLAAIHEAERLGLPFDVVDGLTGTAIGRPKSATFRTADVVGLDTLGHVVHGTAAVIQDDPWLRYYCLPSWLQTLIQDGALGQKSGRGVYHKVGREIRILQPDSGEYRPADTGISAEVERILAADNAEQRFAALRASDDPQARFLWSIHREVFHYSAHLLERIADTARDVDLALRWGFGWQRGPFELWQSIGWARVAKWIAAEVSDGSTMTDTPLPDWVHRIEAVHTAEGSWSASTDSYRGRSQLDVYRRQRWPERVLGESTPSLGDTIDEDDAVRIWSAGDDVGVVSLKSRMHTLGGAVLDGVHRALDVAEARFSALVIWSPDPPFSVGANLKEMSAIIDGGDPKVLEQAVGRFQSTTMRLRHSSVPVVGAARGLCLGGGCEFLMHCDRVVAALETYAGLVESGVGLLPAGGGSKELALRASQESAGGDVFPTIRRVFEVVAMAKVCASARQAQAWGLLRDSDVVVPNGHELLHVALANAHALAESAYRSPAPARLRVAGRTGIANLESGLANMREGGFISAHDYIVARQVAAVLCGGEVDAGSEVDEDWMLAVERRAFVELALLEKTQQRIQHTLATGKPLRN